MTAPAPLKDTRLGMIVLVGEDESSPLPLEQTAVNVQILGLAAAVAVTQTFSNPLEQPAEFEYLFPLPENAAIMDFEPRCGTRLIRAELKETAEARKAFEQARDEGRQAGLLEARRPNLFAVRLANLLPGERIHATLRYQQRLAFNDGAFEFVFPMGLTPRYHAPADRPAPGVDAPITTDLSGVGPVEITLSTDAGMPVEDPSSPSHPLALTRLDERRFSLRLAERAIPDHDFVLHYAISGSDPLLAAWTAGSQNKADYFLATLVPPALSDDALQTTPRAFIFVLDRSGSMMGEPIAQARNALRACLRALNPGDVFNILLFDDRIDWYQPAPVSVDQAAIDAADSFLDKVEGRGGTEIVLALEAALDAARKTDKQPYIVFLTDGAVAGEDRALSLLRAGIKHTRIFTFGIGPSVNRALLNSLARVGRGAAEFLQLSENIENAIIRFQDRVSFPVLSDLSLTVENGEAWDVFPQPISDLYAGQPVEIVGRLKPKSAGGQRQARLTLTGQRGSETVKLQLNLPREASSDPLVGRLWAQARIQHLMDAETGGDTRAEIIALALEHRLASAHTAFVAVDKDIANPAGKPKLVRVAQPLPAGLELEGFLGSQGVSFGLSSGMMPYAAAPSAMRRAMSNRSFLAKNASSADDMMDLPAFLRSRPASAIPEPLFEESNSPIMHGRFTRDEDEPLRRLARAQRLDGSWNGDVEQTAAALLAFVRAGFTTRAGHYRVPVRRAARWLIGAKASGFAAIARAAALRALAETAGGNAFERPAEEAWSALGQPADDLQRSALKILELVSAAEDPHAPDHVRSLDELRLAGLADARHARVELNASDDLTQAWLASLGK